LQEAARPYGLRLLGPDSLGIIVPRLGLNASLGHVFPRAGSLALVAESGAVLAPMIEWATAQGIGFSCVVALGERLDIDFSDLLDWLTHDPDTRAILLCLETLKRARPFLSAARAAARTKPVLVVRAGRGGDAASHQTDAVYDAAFRRAGMLRVRSLRELFWAAETLALDLPVTGDRLAIVGNGRGLGLLAADTWACWLPTPCWRKVGSWSDSAGRPRSRYVGFCLSAPRPTIHSIWAAMPIRPGSPPPWTFCCGNGISTAC